MTIAALKLKLATHTGTSAEDMALTLTSTGGGPPIPLADPARPLGFYSPADGGTLRVTDTDPHSLAATGWLEDTSKVEKYVMSDAAYAGREGTYRAYKEERRKVRFEKGEREERGEGEEEGEREGRGRVRAPPVAALSSLSPHPPRPTLSLPPDRPHLDRRPRAGRPPGRPLTPTPARPRLRGRPGGGGGGGGGGLPGRRPVRGCAGRQAGGGPLRGGGPLPAGGGVGGRRV